MRKIAVLTSGGDAPGMNACIRAVVRTAIVKNISVLGVNQAYEGLIDGDVMPLDAKDVANILQRGGTILKSSRSKRFFDKANRAKAMQHLTHYGVSGLIVIGGDGTFKGASEFSKEHHIPIIGIPGTIDNDMYGTDFTIGYDTAVNTVVSAVDKIRDTAASHNRLFVVEVMGRDAGFIALRSGLATGAEAVLVPEVPTLVNELIEKLNSGRRANKTSGIVIVAEGDDSGGAFQIAKALEKSCKGYEIRVSVLGHIQRGGNPSAMDRTLASRLGFASVNALINNQSNVMIGLVNNEIVFTPLEKAVKHHKSVNKGLLDLIEVLSV